MITIADQLRSGSSKVELEHLQFTKHHRYAVSQFKVFKTSCFGHDIRNIPRFPGEKTMPKRPIAFEFIDRRRHGQGARWCADGDECGRGA